MIKVFSGLCAGDQFTIRMSDKDVWGLYTASARAFHYVPFFR